MDWEKEIDEELEKQKRKKKSLAAAGGGSAILGSSLASPSVEKKTPVSKPTPIPAPLPKPKVNTLNCITIYAISEHLDLNFSHPDTVQRLEDPNWN